MADDFKDSAAGKRAEGAAQRQKDLAKYCVRSYLSKVTQDGDRNSSAQREGLGTASLAAPQVQTVLFPVDVFEAQRADFARPQPVNSQQHENRVVTNRGWAITFGVCQEALNIFPGRRGRQYLISEDARCFYGISQTAPAQILLFSVPEEGLQARSITLNSAT